jgi:PAP2 superfamily protein
MNATRIRQFAVVLVMSLSYVFVLINFAHGASDGLRGATDGLDDAWGYKYRPQSQGGASPRHAAHPLNDPTRWLQHWNEIAINASGLDHTPVAPGENRVFGEQFGPARASRAMAIVHIAVFDTINAIAGHYQSYTGVEPDRGEVSIQAGIAQAARDTLAGLFPSQAPSFDALLASDLAKIPNGRPKANGIDLGHRTAVAILTMRANDGSHHTEPRVGIDFFTSDAPGKWRQDPISELPLALGALWGGVKPFVMGTANQFRAPLPPALDSAAYAMAFNEVKRLGGDGINTPTERTAEQTEIGTYWAYDGTPSLCAPPRLYNQIAVQIAEQMGANHIETARLLALINVAMADAAIAVWEAKYFYQFWRPITGIRESDPGTGPTGLGDGNSATIGDLKFSPLGAPASNLTGPNFTPPFPAYPSGHAGFGGAVFQVLRKFFGTDDIPFTFVSDEFNGVTVDNQGNVRPLAPRSFTSLSEAEEENGQSRIYLGIHWSFDKTEGIAQGRQVANFVLENAFVPLHKATQP